MPREEGPIELRSTADLQRRFDFITSNSRVVREAIECMFILQELGRREAAEGVVTTTLQRQAARMTPANEGTTDAHQSSISADPEPARPGEQDIPGGPHGAAG